ncbi:hypothetical protein AOXY_G9806 [Acipenser oxyrinchus oxyrinchus]|uniref:CMP/dCMP-type deaminase domain-containing protein n=1 Tax=Acipenser oxyrinchus oxyrinchus TaxID=40147 RepID=A0AAD8DIP1_ACIOX|nr:hypothetical protein AOXY_G9806 [Acipenser oxyrinchus oxyrinchus]
MEYSTDCEEPAEIKDLKYCKSGIVICEPNKPKWIVTIDCSRKKLHAAQQALLNLPNAVKGCEVFLSKKPCSTCAKLLIQGKCL